MGKFLVSGLVAGAMLGALSFAPAPAVAADLGGRPVRPPRDYAPAYESRPALDLWTGFYFGGTVGSSFGDALASGDIGNFSFSQEGFQGTLFAGYNWQVGRTVLGLEADIGTGNFGAKTNTFFGPLETQMNAIGSLRARAGLLITPALLLYGTGGLAWANMDVGYQGLDHKSQTFFGYQVGGGMEYMMTNNVALRFEYIYTDLDKEKILHSGQTNFYNPDFHTVRAGLSFKF